MIGTILELLTGPLGALAGAVIALLGAFWMGRKGGSDAEARERDKDTVRRLDRGRARLRDGRDLDPDERLRRNDGQNGKW